MAVKDKTHLTQRVPDWRVRAAFFEHFSGFEFFLLPSIVHARPHAGNASRWAVHLSTMKIMFAEI